MLLVQVFSETYEILIVGSPLELKVNATDSFEFRSSHLYAGTSLDLFILVFVDRKPNMILLTHISEVLVALFNHDVGGSETMNL